jgi:hypothetical protein
MENPKTIVLKTKHEIQVKAVMKIIKLLAPILDDDPDDIQNYTEKDFGELTLLELANQIETIVNPPIKKVLEQKKCSARLAVREQSESADEYDEAIKFVEGEQND